MIEMQTGSWRTPRWIGSLVLSFALVLVASGCSPRDAAGLEVRFDGTLVAVNCGTWIRGVRVTDADSGRAVWTSQATQTKNETGIDDVGEVVVGVLPSARWSASTYEPNPRPERWRFVITSFGEPTVVEVADADLKPGMVYRADGTSLPASQFNRRVCNPPPISPKAALLVALAGLVALALGIAGGLQRRGRRVSAVEGDNLSFLPPPPPRGWSPPPPRSGWSPTDGSPPAGPKRRP